MKPTIKIKNNSTVWVADLRIRVGMVVSHKGYYFQNTNGKNIEPLTVEDDGWFIVGKDSKLDSADIFHFVQKGFGNTNNEIYELKDVFRGWSNDGTLRYAEAEWLGGDLNDSENFRPMFAAEREI